MKRLLLSAALFLLAIGLPFSAFAGEKSTRFTIDKPTQVGGVTLKSGDYKVEYKTNGSNADVTFVREGKQVANVTGQVKQLPAKVDSTQVTTDTRSSVPVIAEIDFGGTTTGITFASPNGNAGE